ncbi:hypothetical protein RRG08_042839 [Elysia crispata]|uniref:Uncharacterized protein n=1 Tax=Elysia crispata TaxID=231223 RepID=A0AAE1DZL3_9GAST|nr:hypothetical protein RRG08_042839 [Elysia crispata]
MFTLFNVAAADITDSNGENCRRESEKLPKRPRRTTETRKALSQFCSFLERGPKFPEPQAFVSTYAAGHVFQISNHPDCTRHVTAVSIIRWARADQLQSR